MSFSWTPSVLQLKVVRQDIWCKPKPTIHLTLGVRPDIVDDHVHVRFTDGVLVQRLPAGEDGVKAYNQLRVGGVASKQSLTPVETFSSVGDRWRAEVDLLSASALLSADFVQ